MKSLLAELNMRYFNSANGLLLLSQNFGLLDSYGLVRI